MRRHSFNRSSPHFYAFRYFILFTDSDRLFFIVIIFHPLGISSIICRCIFFFCLDSKSTEETGCLQTLPGTKRLSAGYLIIKGTRTPPSKCCLLAPRKGALQEEASGAPPLSDRKTTMVSFSKPSAFKASRMRPIPLSIAYTMAQ